MVGEKISLKDFQKNFRKLKKEDISPNKPISIFKKIKNKYVNLGDFLFFDPSISRNKCQYYLPNDPSQINRVFCASFNEILVGEDIVGLLFRCPKKQSDDP